MQANPDANGGNEATPTLDAPPSVEFVPMQPSDSIESVTDVTREAIVETVPPADLEVGIVEAA